MAMPWDVKEPLPYYFVFDMGKEYTLFRFGFANPVAPAAHVWAGTSKAGYVEAILITRIGLN